MAVDSATLIVIGDKTLVLLGGHICKSPEEYKAWSQNLGHENERARSDGSSPRAAGYFHLGCILWRLCFETDLDFVFLIEFFSDGSDLTVFEIR